MYVYLIHAGYYTAQEFLMKNLTLGTFQALMRKNTAQENVQSIQQSATPGNTVTQRKKQSKTKEAVCEYLRVDLMTYLCIDIFKLKNI